MPATVFSQGKGKGKSATGVSAADRRFMIKAAQGGIAEVKTGQLATQKANNNQVKNFGQQMVTDHTKSNQELMQLAASKGVTLPKDTDAKHKAAMARMMKLSGMAFDAAYMKQMVKDHQAMIALFQRESRQGRDPQTKAWAAKTLPALQHHLQMARQLTQSLAGATIPKGSSSKGSMSGAQGGSMSGPKGSMSPAH